MSSGNADMVSHHIHAVQLWGLRKRFGKRCMARCEARVWSLHARAHARGVAPATSRAVWHVAPAALLVALFTPGLSLCDPVAVSSAFCGCKLSLLFAHHQDLDEIFVSHGFRPLAQPRLLPFCKLQGFAEFFALAPQCFLLLP